MLKLFIKTANQSYIVLDNNFIKNHMPFSDGEFVKVYIYLKYLHEQRVDCIEIKQIASFLNLLESDVIKAIEFFCQRNLLEIKKDNDGNIEIEFKDESSYNNIDKDQSITPPIYSTDELSKFFETDEKFRGLLEFAQKAYCRTFNKNDIDILLEIYDWLKLPIEVIYMLINYVTINKNNKNLKYLEQIAIKWKDLNIDSIEKAEEYIRSLEDNYKIKRLVLQNLGIYNRAPTKVEDDIMNRWINDWKMPQDVILYACTLTKNANNPTVNYINGIIRRWFEQGLKDLESIKKYEQQGKEKREKEKTKKPNAKRALVEERDPSEYDGLEELFKRAMRGNDDE